MTQLAKRMLKRLSNTRGDTLVEVMVAILISGMAILLLALVIGAGSRMLMNSNQWMDDYIKANNALVEGKDESSVGVAKANGSADTLKLEMKDSTWSDEIGGVTYVVGSKYDETIVVYQ